MFTLIIYNFLLLNKLNWVDLKTTQAKDSINVWSQRFLKKDNTVFEVLFNSYTNETSTTAIEKQKGFFASLNGTYYNYNPNNYSISTKKMKVVIDSAEQKLFLLKNEDAQILSDASGNFDALQVYIKKFMYKKQDQNTFKYLIEFSENAPVKKIEYLISENLIKSITIFYANIEDENEVLQSPKLSIQYNIITTKKYENLKPFAYFFNERKMGREFLNNGQYKNFSINDLRKK
jgi:uncharacterized protein YbcV (DUF1398 family)